MASAEPLDAGDEGAWKHPAIVSAGRLAEAKNYPLLIEAFRRLAPWEVEWVDPAPAIARQVERILEGRGFSASAGAGAAATGEMILTSGRAPGAALKRFLAGFNLAVR